MVFFKDQLDKETVRSHIKTLFILAKIDNKLLEVEVDFLYELGKRHQLSKQEIDEIVREEHKVKFKLAQEKEAKVQQLYELIKMMLVDHKLDDREAALCIRVAMEMGFNKAMVSGFVSALVTAADDGGADPELSKKEVNYYVNHPEIVK